MAKDSEKRPPARKPTRNLRRAAGTQTTRVEHGSALILPASVRRAIANRRPAQDETPDDAPDARVTTTRADGG